MPKIAINYSEEYPVYYFSEELQFYSVHIEITDDEFQRLKKWRDEDDWKQDFLYKKYWEIANLPKDNGAV